MSAGSRWIGRARFGYPLWLLETFVDPRLFRGTGHRAANWLEVGETRGYRRMRTGYSPQAEAPKRVWVRPLIADARQRLAHPVLDPHYHPGAPKLMLRAEQMRSLPAFFAGVPDPRRAQGRRHPLPVVLAIAARAVLCGARGYQAIAAWAQDLGLAARARFRCRYRHGSYEVPSRTRIRDVLTRVDPEALDRALQGWNAQMAADEEGLALDGKTMRNALDADGDQTHILGVVGHQTQSTALNDYLDFPHVGPVFAIERHTIEKDSVAGTLAKLARKVRRVFDYLGMTANSTPRPRRLAAEG